MKNTTKKCGKRVFSLVFLDPSSPRLASGSHGPSNDFRVKEPARLGKLVTSGLSLSSLSQVPFSINRHPRGVLNGYKVQKWTKLRELRKKKNKEEETKSRHYRIATTIIPYVIFLFYVLRATVG